MRRGWYDLSWRLSVFLVSITSSFVSPYLCLYPLIRLLFTSLPLSPPPIVLCDAYWTTGFVYAALLVPSWWSLIGVNSGNYQ